MKTKIGAAALMLATVSTANAGGIDRSGQFMRVLFEEGGDTGSYTEFSFGSVSPQAGSDLIAIDPLGSYQPFSFSFKKDLSEQLSFALIFDQPFGAEVDYRPALTPFIGPSGAIIGNASITSDALTGVLRYKFNDNYSVHGGLRFQKIGGEISTIIGGVAPSILSASSDIGIGGVLGVAYERPDIALRVALTYNSEIDQDMSGQETLLLTGGGPTEFTITTPASLNLEFQTGIAADTLLFGSIRYVEWEGFNLTTAAGGQYVNFRRDAITYSLGVGRRFNENWSAAVTLGFEEPSLRPTNTLLDPTTGTASIGLGVTYTQGNTKLTGGITYASRGDQSGAGIPANFTDNDVYGIGVRLGFNF